MSSAGIWLMLAAGTAAGPMPDGRPLGTPPSASCAAPGDQNAIVVCGQQSGPSPRLPVRDDRAAPGEDVRYASDGARTDPGPLIRPSRLGETMGKLFGVLRGAVTGSDRGF